MSRWKLGRDVAVGALAAVVGLAATGAAVLYAQSEDGPGGPRGWHGRGGFGLMRMARGLDLTVEQKESFKALADEHRQAVEPLWQKHRELRQEIRKQLDAGNTDAQTVGQLTIDAHQVAQEMAESRKQVKEKFEALLTPEQKTKLEQFESRRGKRGPRGFFGPGRRGPAPPEDEDDSES